MKNEEDFFIEYVFFSEETGTFMSRHVINTSRRMEYTQWRK